MDNLATEWLGLPMGVIRFLTIAEQAAAYLRVELSRGRWSGEMPGKHKFAEELGVNNKTVEAALRILEHEGLLVAQGAGRRRRIVATASHEMPCLRVGIMLYDDDRKLDYIVELVRRLQERGHRPFLTNRSLMGLRMDAKRIAAYTSRFPADAWIVVAGSYDVLEWFSRQPIPAFALFGRQPKVNIAGTGPEKCPAMAEAVRRLAELGHRRIVLLVREERRKPGPGIVERAFLGELKKQGITTGAYNLPDWDNSPKGLDSCLHALFLHSPPTALIADGIDLFAATQQFFLHRGIRVPQEVSVVCADPHSTFVWCHPSVAHIEHDTGIWVRNTMAWVNKVAGGKNERKQTKSKSKFVEGGTIGHAVVGGKLQRSSPQSIDLVEKDAGWK